MPSFNNGVMSKLPLTTFLPSVIPPWQATQFWRSAAMPSARTAELVKAKMEMNVKNLNMKTSQADRSDQVRSLSRLPLCPENSFTSIPIWCRIET